MAETGSQVLAVKDHNGTAHMRDRSRLQQQREVQDWTQFALDFHAKLQQLQGSHHRRRVDWRQPLDLQEIPRLLQDRQKVLHSNLKHQEGRSFVQPLFRGFAAMWKKLNSA